MHFLIFAFSYLRFVVVANSAEFSSRWPVLSFSFFSFCVFFSFANLGSSFLQWVTTDPKRNGSVFYCFYFGLLGFYWVWPCRNGLDLISRSHVGFYWVLLGFTWFSWALLGFYWVWPCRNGLDLISRSFVGLDWFLPEFTGFYWVFPNYHEFD